MPNIVRNVNSPPLTDLLGLRVVERGPQTRVVQVTGEVDTYTAPELAAVLAAQMAAAQVVVVDLDAVRFLASAGMTVLFEASELAARLQRDLRLVCHCPTINRTLTVTGLRDRFTFADHVPGSRAAAL